MKSWVRMLDLPSQQVGPATPTLGGLKERSTYTCRASLSIRMGLDCWTVRTSTLSDFQRGRGGEEGSKGGEEQKKGDPWRPVWGKKNEL